MMYRLGILLGGLPMAQPRLFRTFVSVVLATFALTVFANGQTQSEQNTAQAPPKSKAAVPVTMTECEGTNNCATWTFLGAQGNGHWPSGEIANLSVDHYDNNTVVIRRADSTGSSAGLTAVYTGTRHDDRVGGEFTSSWPGHWDNKSGNWYATVEKDSQSLPTAMHLCQQHCFTFTLENGRYALSAGGPHNGSVPVMTIERFTRESVIIHRTDTGNFPGTGVYSGRMSDDGNSLSGAGWKITWGAALNSLPGSDEGRDRAPGSPQPYPVVVSPVVVCVPWFFTVVCGR